MKNNSKDIFFKIEVVSDWNQIHGIKDEWNQINSRSEVLQPFTTYEWFNCWYQAYCNPEKARIIIIRDNDNMLRAIFPGMLVQMKKGGITLQCFSYAGNSHSPRYGIISKKGDEDAIRISLSAIWGSLHEKIDMAILGSIDQASSTYQTLTHLELPFLSVRVEHSFESPAFYMPEGWHVYLKRRSINFRGRLNKGINRSKRLGKLGYDIITKINNDGLLIERLKLLDSKTWQHENGTGLFSTVENSKFYTNLIKTFGDMGKLALCFVHLNGKDMAYSLNLIYGTTGYILKTGYDPEYNKCSPGLLNWAYLSEWMASKGIVEVDMLGEADDYKNAWETHRRRHINYWLINKKSLKSLFLLIEIFGYELFKKTLLKKKAKPS